MKPGQKDLAFIAAREGWALTAYPDTHHLAIGPGLNDPSLVDGHTLSMQRTIEIFLTFMKQQTAALERVLPSEGLAANHWGAVQSLTYNIGVGGIKRNEPLLSAIIAFAAKPSDRVLRDKAGLQIVLANSNPDTGPFNLSRRCREAVLFTAGDYGNIDKMPFWDAGKNPHKSLPEQLPIPDFYLGV